MCIVCVGVVCSVVVEPTAERPARAAHAALSAWPQPSKAQLPSSALRPRAALRPCLHFFRLDFSASLMSTPPSQPGLTSGLTSGITRGTPSVMRNALLLSTTVQPFSEAMCANFLLIDPPALNSAMSTPSKLREGGGGRVHRLRMSIWRGLRRTLAPGSSQPPERRAT